MPSNPQCAALNKPRRQRPRWARVHFGGLSSRFASFTSRRLPWLDEGIENRRGQGESLQHDLRAHEEFPDALPPSGA
eukprot:4040434-Pyramimonas_sp.AAC.1